MARTLAIRRLRLAAFAPRDHPAPADLQARLADAARAWLAPQLARALRDRSDGSVLRIRRLAVDITLDAAFDPEGFAALLANAIAAELFQLRAEAPNRPDDSALVVAFPSRAAYLAVLIEALAAGRGTRCWFLRDADGLRFLSPAAAIRTALLAGPTEGEAALMSLSPQRLARVLPVLGPRESDRVLDAFATASGDATGAEDCVAAIAAAAIAAPVTPSPLALYLRARVTAGVGGRGLAAVARLWAEQADDIYPGQRGYDGEPETKTVAPGLDVDASLVAPLPEAVRIAVAKVLASRRAGGTATALAEAVPIVSRFAGLLLLVPGLHLDAIDARVAEWPDSPPRDTAALIAYAALGLCAGRPLFAAWLREPVWRDLFGLDVGAGSAALAERLGGITEAQWQTLAPPGLAPQTTRHIRFLLMPRPYTQPESQMAARCSRAAVRALATLAHGISSRFADRLIGLQAASAPFLWENLLGAGGTLERRPDGWDARLNRPPLDVLLSLSRLAEGSVRLPGGPVRVTRVAP